MRPDDQPKPRRSLATDFAFWSSLSLVGIGILFGGINYFVAPIPIHREIVQRASRVALGLAQVLNKDVWNMDEDAISEFFAKYPNADYGLSSVRFLTEYGDPIFEKVYRDEAMAVRQKAPVYREEQLIGYVEVALSRELVSNAQSVARTLMFIMVGGGTIVLILLTHILVRYQVVRPVRQMVQEVVHVARGDLDVAPHPYRHREIDQISRTVHHMAARIAMRTRQLEDEIEIRRTTQASLESMQSRLEETVRQRTAELSRANQQLQDEIRERRMIEAEMLAISNRERQRIGSDLHDSLGQHLSGTAFLVQAMVRKLRAEEHPEADSAERVAGLLRESVVKTRQIAHGLMPVNDPEQDISVALRTMVSEIRATYGVEFVLNVSSPCVIHNCDVAVHLYRIVEEALHNAITHGQARHIRINISANATEGELSILDDGFGMPRAEADHDGMGLRIMRHRAEAIGGELFVGRRENRGTEIRVTFQNRSAA